MTATRSKEIERGARTFTRPVDPAMARSLWIIATLAVFYGTLIPFEFHGDLQMSLERAKAALGFDAPLSRKGGLSIPDVVQNIVLFIPFGFAGYLASSRLLGVLAGALLLSASAEALQLMTVSRVTSWIDLATNGLGAATGYLMAPVLLRGARRVHAGFLAAGFEDNRRSRTALFLMCLAVLHHLHPFAFSLDLGMIWQQLKVLPESVFISPERGDALTVFHWTLASALLVTASARDLRTRRVVGWLLALAVAAELSQFAIRARIPGLHDVLVATVGIFLGAWAASRRPWKAHGAQDSEASYASTGSTVTMATLLLFCLTIGWDTFHPFRVERFHGISWMPFAEHYSRTTFATLSDAMELVLAGLAVSIVFGCFAQRRAPRNLAAVLVIVSYALMELSQAWIEGRYAGTGDIIALGAGVWLGLRLTPGLLDLAPDTAHRRVPSGNPQGAA